MEDLIAAPVGTVTLVFTDIEGSTALWEHVGPSFKAVLDLHNRIFRSNFAEFGGYEVKTEGDAFMVAFHDAASAVAMCIAVQQKLHDASWPAALNDPAISGFAGESACGTFRGVRVRMGVHTGTPQCQPDPVSGRMDYFGRMVNRAARVGSAGHGGQLLVSSATWEALGREPPPGSVVSDLGEHQIKGIQRPERFRQVAPVSLGGRNFGPLRASHQKRTNLPARLDSFFGREREIAQLNMHVASGHRLITILGAGGMGKTRLSQRIAEGQLLSFPGGVWFCDLTAARNVNGIIGAMSVALDLPLTGSDPEAQLADHVAGRGRVLFVLDNFEQIAEHAMATVGRWLQQAPEAVFMVTSRRLLRIEGERVLHLDPLPLHEAVNLFFDRASLMAPQLQRSDDSEALVGQIVGRLDCMSLAVELAAARTRMLSIQQIFERLSKRFELLRGQRRDQSARQSTLRGVIDWSWDLLEPHERSALAQLSVFQGGCTLEAAEAIVDLSGFEGETFLLDVMEQLVDHSLVRRLDSFPGHARFGMLESIREYAAEKLAAQEHDAGAAHAVYFAGFGTDTALGNLNAAGGSARRQNLTMELENLLRGVQVGLDAQDPEMFVGCGLAASEVYRMRGPFEEGVSLLRRAMAAAVDASDVGRLHYRLGWLLHLAGRPLEAQQHQERALDLFRELGERENQGNVLGNLAWLHREQGRFVAAKECYDAAITVARECGNRRQEGLNLGSLANLHREQGRVHEAREHYERSLAIAREVGDRQSEGIALSNLGWLHRDGGAIPDAMDNFQQALLIAREIGNRRGEGITLANLAALQREQGLQSEARESFDEALLIAREVGNRRGEGITLGQIAGILREQGQVEKASQHYRVAISIAREVGNTGHEGTMLGEMGELFLSQGDSLRAEDHLKRAVRLCEQADPGAAGIQIATLAVLRAQDDEFEEARALLVSGEAMVRGVSRVALGRFLCKKVVVERAAGNPLAAEAALKEAETIAVETGGSPKSGLAIALAAIRTTSSSPPTR